MEENTLQKRNNWFVNYQASFGLPGERNLDKRIKFFIKKDFIDKTIIDVGCNIGQISHYCADNGAKYVLGIDYDEEAIKIARQNNNNSKVEFRCEDIDNYFLWSTLPQFDISCLLSIIDTKELENRFGMLSKLCMKTKEIMYFEGHRYTGDYTNYMQFLHRYTDFTHIEYLGEINDTEGGSLSVGDTRPFYRCSRKIYTMEEATKKIVSFIELNPIIKIAVIGKASCGKTTLKWLIIDEIKRKKSLNILHYNIDNNLEINYIPQYINTREKNKEYNVSIMDDVDNEKFLEIVENGHKHKKLLYFDYRALLYIKNFDIVFYIKTDRMSNDTTFDYDKLSEGLENNKYLKRIYHINNPI